MPKFTFKLEPVLKQRQREEDQRQRDLAKLLRRRMILESQLRQMQQTIIESKRQLGGVLSGRVERDRVSRFARYSGQVTQRAHAIVRELAKLEKYVVSARDALLEATRNRKAMQLLHDRQYARWKQQQQRREDARIDEFNVQRYARSMMTGVFE